LTKEEYFYYAQKKWQIYHRQRRRLLPGPGGMRPARELTSNCLNIILGTKSRPERDLRLIMRTDVMELGFFHQLVDRVQT